MEIDKKGDSMFFFDATVFSECWTGIAKSTKRLYEECHKINPSFVAYGLSNSDLSKHNTDAVKFVSFDIIKKASISDRNYCGYMHWPANGNIRFRVDGCKNIITIHDILPLQMPDFFGKYSTTMSLGGLKNNYEIKRKRKMYIKRMQRDITISDYIFTISFFSQKSIMDYFKLAEPPKIISWSGTLPNDVNRRFEPLVNNPYIIFWGGYSARKGVCELVKAFSDLYKNNNTEMDLVLVGEKSSLGEETDKLILEGLRDGRVFEMGYLEDDYLSFLAKRAEALFYLSSWEGFGLPVLEAMAMGCPVVTTKRTSLGEICGDAVLYVNPNDIYEVKAAIKMIETDINLKTQLKVRGYEQSKKYSWSNAAESFLSYIEYQS